MAFSQWNQVADGHGFIVAYPEGTGRGPKSWEMTGRETPARMPDVIFIAEFDRQAGGVLQHRQDANLPNGMSNGGGMAFVLSCTLSDRIAGVGMVSAALDPEWSWCTDHRPVPVIAFHGTADPVCSYNGGWSKLVGATFPSVPGFMANWFRRNQCGPNPIESAVAADVTRLQYTNCADDADVVLYTVKGEGHQWPGGTRVAAEWLIGRYSRSIDVTRQMWGKVESAWGLVPIDCSPALLLMPFGFPSRDGHLALRSTASGGFRSVLAVSSFRLRARLDVSIPSTFSGQRGCEPRFLDMAPLI
jgi:polyhydroxybutyrate depolymerase